MNPSNSPAGNSGPGNSGPGNSGPGNFADTLIDRIRTLGHPLCVGLDPHLDRIPPLFREGSMRPDDPATPAAVRDFLLAVVDRLEDRVAIVKPQSAFFEQLGGAGIAVLEEVIVRARERGLMVLLDAKRGDIGSTAAAYSRAYLHAGSPLAVDALTVNPYLGLDTLEPFGKGAREYARGLFVLVRTSNPGAGSLQDLEVKERPLFEEVARQLSPLAEEMRGPETGWSSLGVVVGATWPAQSIAVREALPHALFLVPGYGAQGGSAAEALCGFVPGPNGLEGGIVSSSRGITFPESGDTNDAAVWEEAIDRAIEQAVAELGEAQR